MNTIIHLDDIGLFRKRRSHEQFSQRERAEQIRDQFAHCMDNARSNGCVMPMLCAYGDQNLSCAHLTVDYRNFTGGGIPLTGRARVTLDARLRAIGTQVYRNLAPFGVGALPGDVHLPALSRISSFPGRKASSTPKVAQKQRAKSPARSTGLLGRLFGF